MPNEICVRTVTAAGLGQPEHYTYLVVHGTTGDLRGRALAKARERGYPESPYVEIVVRHGNSSPDEILNWR